MNNNHHIDVHPNVVPLSTPKLPGDGGDPSGTVTPEWSPECAIAFMD